MNCHLVMAHFMARYGAGKPGEGRLCAITALKGRVYGAALPSFSRFMAHFMAQLA